MFGNVHAHSEWGLVEGFGLVNFVQCLILILSFFLSGMFDGGVITYPKNVP